MKNMSEIVKFDENGILTEEWLEYINNLTREDLERFFTTASVSSDIRKEKIDKAIEYIENEMPCLWEVDDIWEDINGNYQHNYKEYDTQILLNKLKGVDKE